VGEGRGWGNGQSVTIHYSLFSGDHPYYFQSMDFAANLSAIQHRIEAAATRAGREPSSITLLAVTKSHPPEVVNEAARLGLTAFGENKVQEAKPKFHCAPGVCSGT